MASQASAAVAVPAERPAAAGTVRDDFNVAAHGLRGVASMMVFFAHLMGGTARHVYSNDQAYVSAITPIWNVGTFGVELFFVISGFVILPSVRKYSLGEFGLRRFLRLYPLFLAFSVLFVILNGLTRAYPDLDNPLTVVSGLLFVNLFTGTEQLTPNAWSLSFEVMFYLATAVTYYFVFTRRSLVLGALAVVASLAFWVSFPITTYFVMGMGVRLLRDNYVLPQSSARPLEMLSCAGMVWLASIAHHEYSWADVVAPEVVPLMLCTATYFYLAVHTGSLTSKLLGNRFVLYLGTVSYSLYIVHPYVYLPMRMLFARLDWFGSDPFVALGLFALTVTPPMLLATALVHNWLERWPYAWYFRQGIYRHRTGGTRDRQAPAS